MDQTAGLAGPLGCVAAACILGMAAGAQSLFDSGRVGFTEQQATRGQTAYAESCASCHGPNLNDGQFAAPVKGAAFKAHWHDQPPEALWSLIMKRMPPASPGSLGSRTYADIDAYLLRENGDKAGTTELQRRPRPRAAHRRNLAPHPRTTRARASAPPSSTIRTPNIMPPWPARQLLLRKLTPVSDAMLRDPAAADWLMWRGTYATLGYSPLDQINTQDGAQSWRRLDLGAAAQRQ